MRYPTHPVASVVRPCTNKQCLLKLRTSGFKTGGGVALLVPCLSWNHVVLVVRRNLGSMRKVPEESYYLHYSFTICTTHLLPIIVKRNSVVLHYINQGSPGKKTFL